MIRSVALNDAKRIAEIYNYYIEQTTITFEYDNVSEEDMRNRILKIQAKGYPFIVYQKEDIVIGYAYLNSWRERVAYNITLETSIYLDRKAVGKGIGETLYKELIHRSRSINIHSLIGGISLPNVASQMLHKKLGFKLVGNFEESGIKFNKLIDVEFWQLIL